MPDILTRTGLGGRHRTTVMEYPVQALRESLKLTDEASAAWSVIEPALKDVVVAVGHQGADLLNEVEERVRARAQRTVDEIVKACADLRAHMSNEQKTILASRSAEVRPLIFS